MIANRSRQLVCALENASRALMVDRPPVRLLERYLQLRELAEFPLFDSPGRKADERIKSIARRVTLAPQARFNEQLLAHLRAQLLDTEDEGDQRAEGAVVYVAPFDVLSRNGGAARVLGLAEALGSSRGAHFECCWAASAAGGHPGRARCAYLRRAGQ